MKKYEIKHLLVKPLSEATRRTTVGLKGIMKALGWMNPKTVVYYQNGTIEELDLNGKIYQLDFPDQFYIIKIELGTNVTEIDSGFFYDGFESLQELIIPNTVKNISNTSFGIGGGNEMKFIFLKRTKSEVMSMENYSFGAGYGNIFSCTDGDIVIT